MTVKYLIDNFIWKIIFKFIFMKYFFYKAREIEAPEEEKKWPDF